MLSVQLKLIRNETKGNKSFCTLTKKVHVRKVKYMKCFKDRHNVKN